MHNWVEIDVGALKRNYRRIRNLLKPGVSMAPVIKAEAYGHGLIPVAKALAPLSPDWFAVSKFSEAMALRDAGIATPILVLSGLFPSELEEALARSVTPVVYTMEQLIHCESVGKKKQIPYPVHVKIDTGMGRLGFREEAFEKLISMLQESPWIRLDGVMSHFADADDESSSYPLFQMEKFRRFLSKLQDATKKIPPFLHMANSAGTLRYRESHFTMVRPGIALYGPTTFTQDFEPVMHLKARILQIKEVPPQTPIGYARSFVTPHSMVVATLSVGYGDGYPRALSNKAEVIIRGRRCPVIGRISMNLITVDLSQLPSLPCVGEEAVLLGKQGEGLISAEELAAKAGTIGYEIYCRIGSNPVKRLTDSENSTG